MDKIILQNTLPKVFSQRTDIQSDVWKQYVALEKGRTYLVEANSGTGKSSLCSFIIGYRNDYEGTILFDDTDISTLRISDWVAIRKRSLSLLWQDMRLFPELTAMENIRIKNKLTGFQKRKTIEAWFDRLGIVDKRDELVAHMSYGQQQRVAFIRALCQPFDFIFVDEPVSHLDDTNGQIMADILLEEAQRQGAGVVATSIGKRLEVNYDNVLQL